MRVNWARQLDSGTKAELLNLCFCAAFSLPCCALVVLDAHSGAARLYEGQTASVPYCHMQADHNASCVYARFRPLNSLLLIFHEIFGQVCRGTELAINVNGRSVLSAEANCPAGLDLL